MGRKKAGAPNKSEAIREILTATPDMAPKDVVAKLAESGMKATPNLVYFIKGKMKAGTQRRKKVVRAAKAATAGSNGDPVKTILEIKAMAERHGGIAKLKKLVDALAE